MLPSIKLFRYLPKRNCMLRNKHSTRISDKPLGCTFFHPEVQFCMKNLITVDYNYICKYRRFEKFVRTPQYSLLTDSELKNKINGAKMRAKKKLQVPPIIDVASDKVEILSNDSSLDGHDKHHSKTIFIDLSQDYGYYERSVVVREPNGVLRTANKNERFRMNQTFYPVGMREMEVPKMFELENLKKILARKDYEFILDRACLQFEPDEEAFHKILIITYEAVNDENDFYPLHKTRHFGSLAFYLAVKRKIHNLLKFFIEKKKDVIKAAYLIKLQECVEKDLSYPTSTDIQCDKITSKTAFEIVTGFITDQKNNLTNLEPYVRNLKARSSAVGVLKTHGVEI